MSSMTNQDSLHLMSKRIFKRKNTSPTGNFYYSRYIQHYGKAIMMPKPPTGLNWMTQYPSAGGSLSSGTSADTGTENPHVMDRQTCKNI